MLYLVIAVLVIVAALVAAPFLRRNNRLDEVDRFHVARSLTTSWSDGGEAHVHVPAPGDDPEQ